MAKTNYAASSPYYGTTQTNWYLLPWTPRDILADTTDLQFVIDNKYHQRPDLLAYDLYGSPTYWWVFMVRNLDVIRDPIWDMTSGTIIFAPTKARLTELIG